MAARPLPETGAEITTSYLAAVLGLRNSAIDSFSLSRFGTPTSGSELQRIEVRLASGETRSLVLKTGGSGAETESRFYAELAASVPVATPRAYDSRVTATGGAWIVLEELAGGRDGTTWTQGDYRDTIDDIARLHAAFWGHTEELSRFRWLVQPGPAQVSQLAAEARAQVKRVRESGAAEVAPELAGPQRLELMDRVVDHFEDVVSDLLAAGATLVHGDTWFHNLPILDDGRRFMIDWQGCRIWSGFWEFVYFTNLLRPVSSFQVRRDLPLSDAEMCDSYLAALSRYRVELEPGAVARSLLAAQVVHPLTHWLRQVPDDAGRLRMLLAFEGPRSFFESTFAQWEESARAWLGRGPQPMSSVQ